MSLPWAEPFAAALALRHEPGLVLLESMPGFGRLGRRSYLAARPAEVATDGIARARAPGRGLVGGLALVRPRPRDRALPVAAATTSACRRSRSGRFEAWLEFDHERRDGAHPRRRRRRPPAARAARRRATAAPPHAPLAHVAQLAPAPRLRARRAARDRLHPRRRRLPGQPLPAPQHASGTAIRSRSTRACAQTSPAPFTALVRLGGADVISASPERFLRRRGDAIETRPIKGTRPRGADAAEDRRAGARAALEREGPRRERDDRRPRAQRPGPRRALRHRRGRRSSARSSRTPACTTSSRRSRRAAARRRVGRRRRARDLPAGLGHGRAEDPRARDHRGARAGAARPVLRRGRLVRAGRRARAVGRDPHVRRRARTRCTCTSAARSTADSDPAGEWQETMHKAARLLRGRRRDGARAGREALAARFVKVWLERRARRGGARRASRPPTTASWSATGCSRRCAGTAAGRSRSTSTSARLRGGLPRRCGIAMPARDGARAAPRTRWSRPTACADARMRITVTSGAGPAGLLARRRAADRARRRRCRCRRGRRPRRP